VAPALAAAVGLPVLLSAVVARRRAAAVVVAATSEPSRAHGSEQSFITAVALLGQVAINTAPLWLSARAVDAALAGQLVSATSYLRIPLFLVGGLGTVALSAVSGAYGIGDLARARRTSERSAATAALVGLAGVGVLLLVSGPVLRLLYGSAIELAAGTLAAIAVTTVLLMTANVLSLVCFGCDRSRDVAAVWLTVAVVTTIGLAVWGRSTLAVATVTGFGQVVAVVGLTGVAASALRRRPVRGAEPSAAG
jgi:O-antigen/teichoic acid export membrane protein